MPVAAVMAGGRPSVSSASRTAMSGRMTRRGDAALFLGADGDDRDRRDLRAGAGGGRHQAERQARPPGVADAPGVVEVFAGAAQKGGELGDVERGAAAEADDPGDAGAQPGGDRALERGARGIGLDLVEDRHREVAAWSEAMAGSQRPRRRRPGSVTNRTERAEPAADDGAEAARGAGLEDDRRGGVEDERRHGLFRCAVRGAHRAIAESRSPRQSLQVPDGPCR